MKFDKILEKILKKIATGVADSKLKSDVVSIPSKIEFEYIEDGAILSIKNVPITKVGVQPYFIDGKEVKTLKPVEAVEKINVDYSPLSISHPHTNFNLLPVNDRIDRLIGYMINGYFDNNKKYADLHLFTHILRKTDAGQEIEERVKKQMSTDLSIGFETEDVTESGEFDGQHYDRIQKTIKLDHTAILPFEEGRWNILQGVGIGADNKLEAKKMSDELIRKNEQLAITVDNLEKDKAALKQKLDEEEAKVEEAEKKTEEATEKVETLEKEKTEKETAEKEATEKVDTAALTKELESIPDTAKDFKEKILAMEDKKAALELLKSFKDSIPQIKVQRLKLDNDDNAKNDRSGLYAVGKKKGE